MKFNLYEINKDNDLVLLPMTVEINEVQSKDSVVMTFECSNLNGQLLTNNVVRTRQGIKAVTLSRAKSGITNQVLAVTFNDIEEHLSINQIKQLIRSM